MSKRTKIAPPNSLLLITDSGGGTVPEFVPSDLFLSTASCISVGCLMWQDGETSITLGSVDDVDPGVPPQLDQELETPKRIVVISTVEGEVVLSQDVSTARTRVRIWVNRSQEPDEIVVGLE